MNQAFEDYLKLIYELASLNKGGYIKTKLIADHFGYTLQSVNEMVKKLAQKKLITFTPYKGIKLTKKGSLEALRMIRAHRIWEVFLAEKLGLSWELLHEEAEKLEHVTSEHVINRLYDYLNHPKTCKHGNPIPDRFGHMDAYYTTTLWDVSTKDIFTIKRVLDQKAILVFLANHDIHINDQVKVISKETETGLLIIDHHNQTITLSETISKSIYGEVN
ncbi:MAG: iron dependent repressor, metal binding and dimerization domain protein [Candidatus Izemoplasmataceae bacterium]